MAALLDGAVPVDKAVCTMAIMDMPDLIPLFTALPAVFSRGGAFVFSITHPPDGT